MTSTAPPYSVLLLRCDPDDAAGALRRALEQAGYRKAVGLAPSADEIPLDPHERTRRFFRLRQVGSWTAILELGSDQAADYLMVGALGATKAGDVLWAAFEGEAPGVAPRNGAICHQLRGKPALELWLEDGNVVDEVSTLDPGGRQPAAILSELEAPETSPCFEDGSEDVVAFYRDS